MLAVFLSPVYLLFQAYILLWLYAWADSCSPALHSLFFRIPVTVLYLFFAVSPLTGFLITKEPLHHFLRVISNYWLGTLEYILLFIITFDVIRRVTGHSFFMKHRYPAMLHTMPKNLVIFGGFAIGLIEGVLVPVTVLQAGPCVVTQVKTEENDGYKAVQVGFVDKREKLVNKPVKGHFDKAGVSYKRFVREFRFENSEEYNVKDEIKADIFAAGDKVDATAISKGKGFQGAIKRLGQSRGPMAHGSKFHRHQGSNGSATTPGRVFKGKGMPGQMGNKKITTQNLEIVKVDVENNLILVKGAVPGPKKSLVTLKETVKACK